MVVTSDASAQAPLIREIPAFVPRTAAGAVDAGWPRRAPGRAREIVMPDGATRGTAEDAITLRAAGHTIAVLRPLYVAQANRRLRSIEIKSSDRASATVYLGIARDGVWTWYGDQSLVFKGETAGVETRFPFGGTFQIAVATTDDASANLPRIGWEVNVN
jgi:hypothetical protein